MKKLILLISFNFACFNLQASVKENEFELVARKFEKFATSLGQKAIPDYKNALAPN